MNPIKKVLGAMRNGDNDFDLIQQGDRICVGLSGGKDSCALLYCLYLYKRFSKKDYELFAIHCDLNFGEEGFGEMAAYFKELGIEIINIPTQIYDILKLHLDKNKKLECSLCSRLRKGAIIKAAKQYQCNKLAFGHHNEDAVETLFMNMIHGGRIATFKPKTYLERSDITLIRPLIYAYENDIANMVERLSIPIMRSNCPNDGNSERQQMKELMAMFYQKYGCHENFSSMLRNQEQLQLFQPIKKDKDE